MSAKPYSPKDSSTWHKRYEKASLQWADLAHMRTILIPLILLFFLISLYSVVYTALSLTDEEINTTVKSGILGKLWFLLKLATSVLLPLLGAIFGIRILSKQSEEIIRAFHDLPDDYRLAPEVRRRLFGVPPMPTLLKKAFKYPFITLAKPDDLDDIHWARWFGGPATLVIYDGVAVYLERGNRFSRVLGPGLPMPTLERYETIREVVDLRPREEDGNVVAWTKDGVEVECKVKARVQINSSKAAKRKSVILKEGDGAVNLIYPFDPDSVKTVVERTAVRLNNETKALSETNWHGAAIGTVTGKVKAYIAAHSFDELALQKPHSPQFLSFNISNELTQGIRAALNNAGTNLVDLQITDFSPKNHEVFNKLREYWNAEKEKNKAINEGRTEAKEIRAKQNAQTEAYQEFLNRIIDNLQEINKNTPNTLDVDKFTEASVLLLTEVLEQSLSDPLLGAFVAKEGLSTLKMLKENLKIT